MEETTTPNSRFLSIFKWTSGVGTPWERLVEPHPAILDAGLRRRSRLLTSVLLPVVPTTAALFITLALFQPAIDPVTLLALKAVGYPLLIIHATALLLSRSPFAEWGAYMATISTEVGIWALLAMTAATPTVGIIGTFLLIAVLLATLFLPLAPVIAIAMLNLLGTILLPLATTIGATSFFLLFSLQLVAYPFLIASAWVRHRDLVTIETKTREMETILNSIPDTVMSMDDSLRLMAANHGAHMQMAHWFATRADTGVSLYDAWPKSLVRSLQAAVHRSMTHGRVSFNAEQIPTNDGTRDLSFIVNPMRTVDGADDGYVVLVSDLTEQNQAERLERTAFQQKVQIDQLQELNDFKTNLLNTASHELRTPLTPIRLQLTTLQSDPNHPLSDSQLNAIQILDRNTQRLDRLVEDILDVSKLQSQNFVLSKRPVDMVGILEAEYQSFSPVAAEKGVKIFLTSPDDPAWVQGDLDRLGQVISNLLGNALKFTDKDGTIAIFASVTDDALRVEVTDTGSGMDPERVFDLFQPFSQIHDEPTLAKGGSGLGLYICKGIVEGHGGEIGAKSEGAEKGSTLWFSLPLSGQEESFDDGSGLNPAP